MSTTPPAPDPAPPSAASRLRRPNDDRWLAGVCAGLARELRVDPLAVRVVTLILTVVGGAGLIIYLAGVLLIPAEGENDSLLRKAVDGEDRPLVLGLLLVGFVACAVFTNGFVFGFGWGPEWGFLWLVLAGLGLLWFLRREDRAGEQPTVSDDEAPTAVINEPKPRRPRSTGRLALGITLSGIAVVGAIGALGGDDVRWDILLASTVIALGAALVVVSPFGGARALIPLGLLLAAGTGIAAAADLQLSGGAGERVYRPQYVGDIKPAYNLAAGRQEVDLRELVLPDGTTSVEVEQGFGELVVRLPEKARVVVDARVSGGEIEALGRESNGFDADEVFTDGSGRATIALDAHLGFGYIAIVRGDDPVGHHDDDRRFGALGVVR